jgi:PST family polysaccharide transporter/lipopolysaccharide exporter
VEQLGYYALAFTTANFATTYLAKLASRILFPAYSKIQEDKEAVKRVYLKVIELLGIVVLPAAIGLMLLANEFVLALYGEKWRPAAEVLQVLAVFGVIRSFSATNGYLFNGIGRPNIDFYISTGRLAVIGILIYPLTVRYGLVGTAVSIVIPMAIHFVVGTMILRKLINVETGQILKALLGTSLRCLVMASVVMFGQYYADLSSVLSLVMVVVAAGVVYSMLSFVPARRLLSEK